MTGDLFQFDKSICQGNRLVGIDEAGRGPLAGPVVAASVILPDMCQLPLLRDSKCLSANQREILYEAITRQAIVWSVALSSNEEIDTVNILNATFSAMKMSVEKIDINGCMVIVDGNRVPKDRENWRPIIDGDSKSAHIAAASIIAKVTRDRIMDKYHLEYPKYGFKEHKGYGTEHHRLAIRVFGPSAIHRKTFKCVSEYINSKGASPWFDILFNRINTLTEKAEIECILSQIEYKKGAISTDEYDFLLHVAKDKKVEISKQVKTMNRGRIAEKIAADWLKSKGFEILKMNYSCRNGEIDIISKDGDTIVFIEVKLRLTSDFGDPFDGISDSKIKKIVTTAEEYLAMSGNFDVDCRFDILGISRISDGKYKFHYIKNAYTL